TDHQSEIINGPMAQASALSPDLIRLSVALARAIATAARSWSMYPPEHQIVEEAVRRFREAVTASASGAAVTFGVTPRTLLVAGLPLPGDSAVGDTARLLHDHDVLQLTFLGDIPAEALHALLP